MNMLFDSLHGNLQRVLDLRQQQLQLTSSNIANADTPGFKAKVISFDQLLPEVMESGSEMNIQKTQAGHFGVPGMDAETLDIEELEAPPWSLDGNSVVAEREISRLASNKLVYNALTEGMSRRLGILRYAASNGRS